MQILEYSTEKISTILEFSCGAEKEKLYGIYIFQQIEQMENPCISCETIDDLRTILKNHFVCIRIETNKFKVQFMKIDQPDQILYESDPSLGPNYWCQPILFEMNENDSKRILFMRGWDYDKGTEHDFLLEINKDGSVEEKKDYNQLRQQLRSKTQHLTRNLE